MKIKSGSLIKIEQNNITKRFIGWPALFDTAFIVDVNNEVYFEQALFTLIDIIQLKNGLFMGKVISTCGSILFISLADHVTVIVIREP